MKKIVGIIAAAALCAGMATAQDEDAGIRFGAWCRSIYSPIGFNGEDLITQGSQTSWDGNYRIGMTIAGVSEYVGFEVNPDFQKEGVKTHDMNYVWVRPFDFLRIDIGQVRDQTLQQGACFGMWNMVRLVTQADDSFTFTMLANGDDSQGIADGIILKIDPMEALHIGVFLGDKAGESKSQLFTDTFTHYSAISAGYKLEGIGQVKLGVWMQETGTDNDSANADKKAEDKFWTKIEAAFDLTMIENLNASIGFKIPTGFVYKKADATDAVKLDDGNGGVKDTYYGGAPRASEPFQINLSGDYNLMDNFILHALIATKIYKYSFVGGEGKFADGTVFAARFGVGAEYGIAEDLSLLADIRLATKEWREDQVLADKASAKGADNLNMPIGFMVGVKKTFSNGDLTIGFEGAINDTFQQMSDSAYGCGESMGEKADPDTFKFLVPIVFTCSF